MNTTRSSRRWWAFIVAALVAVSLTLPIVATYGAAVATAPDYLAGELFASYAVDMPRSWALVLPDAWASADTLEPPYQSTESILPDTFRAYEFSLTEDTALIMEIRSILDPEGTQAGYYGFLSADVQRLAGDGEWTKVSLDERVCKIIGGVKDPPDYDENWMNTVGYPGPELLPAGQYRVYCWGSQQATNDGTVVAYWKTRGTVDLYAFREPSTVTTGGQSSTTTPPATVTSTTAEPSTTSEASTTSTTLPGDLSIADIQVFQPIEGTDLAAHRWTAVRVFTDLSSPTPGAQAQVTIRLSVNGRLFESRGSVTVKSRAAYTQREIRTGADSANFFLPPWWVDPVGPFDLEVLLSPQDGVQDPDQSNNSASWYGTTYESYPIDLKMVLLDSALTEAQANEWYMKARRFMLDTYPIPGMHAHYPIARINALGTKYLAVLDARAIDVVRRKAGAEFAVGLYLGWKYGEGNRGWNSPYYPYSPGVGFDWPFTLSHEIGHTYLGAHEEASNADDVDGVPLPEGFRYQQSMGRLLYIPAPTVVNGVPTSSWINIMGDPYAEGVNAWINKESYDTILHKRESGPAEVPQVALRSRTRAAGEQTLALHGCITGDSRLIISPPCLLEGPPTLHSEVGSYTAELYALDGSVIASTSFTVQPLQTTGLDEASEPTFRVELPYSPQTAALVLFDGRREIYRLERSANAPQVTIEQPGSGQPVSGGITVAWDAFDADADSLTYDVFYSSDDGATWDPIALYWTDASLALDGAYLPGSDAARVRVVVSDGLNFTAADSPAFQVPTHAPTVTILSPEAKVGENEPWEAGAAGVLSADGLDIEDGEIAPTAYEWSSDKDGTLGQGALLSAGLSAGEHTVTVTVTDSDGQRGSASVTIHVAAPAKEPLGGLWSPLLWVFIAGALLVLAGVAVTGRGLWLAERPADGALATLYKEGEGWARRYRAGQVDGHFMPGVLERLRTYDRQGDYWALDPFQGQWLRWAGQAWYPSQPPPLRGRRLGIGLTVVAAGIIMVVVAAVLQWVVD